MGFMDDYITAQQLREAHLQELEIIIGLLAVKYGQRNGNGYLITFSEEEALELRSQLPPRDPAIIYSYDPELAHFMVNVI